MKSVIYVCVLVIFIFDFITSEWSEDSEDIVSTVNVEAVLGRTASMPCNVTPGGNEDRVYMVLWFRKKGGKPIYSFDVRGRSFNKALQWSDPAVFGPRAYFATVTEPSALTLNSVQLDDEGVYRCRVDYKNNPTRNFQVRLNVIVPPHQMLLYDKSGGDVTGVVGPLEEGAALELVCEVRGGRPPPTVSWFVNNRPAPEYIGIKTDSHVMINRLEIPSVRREDLNKTFKCSSSNNPMLTPLEKSVRLEMNLAPLSVSLVSRPNEFIAGEAAPITCISEGSRPSAQISWLRENRSFQKENITDYSNETWSVSTLMLYPQPEDNGIVVKCVASNPKLPSKAIGDQITLNVVYNPLVSLKLGSTLNPQDIKEGDDVYFECIVRANPREHRISWFRNSRPVTQNMSSGIILSTRSLVLQKVTRKDAGMYSCSAANARGETSSDRLKLRVQYAPVCVEPSTHVVGAALDEMLRVRCTVNADPTDVTFLWQFNNSGESFDVSAARFETVNGSISELSYTPASERDYGALSCRGSNSVGKQTQPCVFQVVPAARPAPPHNCTIAQMNESNWIDFNMNDDEDTLVIRCFAGYDGGLPQLVVFEALDSTSGIIKFNYTANETDGVAVFVVPINALWSSGNAFRLSVHSRNDKGASERVTLHALPYSYPEPRTVGIKLVGLSGKTFWGSVITALCISLATIIALIVRKKRRRIPLKPQTGLQVNSGDGQYVVAYTLKAKRIVRPDILNPQPPDREVDGTGCPEEPLKALLQVNNEMDLGLPATPTARTDVEATCLLQQQRVPSSLSRRGQITTEEIPGPESCV